MKKTYSTPEVEIHKAIISTNLLDSSPRPGGDDNHLDNSTDEDAGVKFDPTIWDKD